jgi:peptide/nickel transport system substrate-binding protein
MMRVRLWLVLIALLSVFAATAAAQSSGELRFCLRAEPKTFNPLLVADEPSETIRYLTGGVLVRFNRLTQKLDPELALSWKVTEAGRKISFKLREGVSFSDGSPFSAEDVAFTIRALMDPNLHSPTGDSFRSAEGAVKVDVTSPRSVAITFPGPVAGLERLFDQVAVLSSRSPRKEMAVLGPFYVAEHKAGSYVLLKRNPYYWKRDVTGKRLPYLDSIRLDIQQNRDVEMLRFRRGEIQLINSLDGEDFNRLAGEMPAAVHDAGPALDTEQMWFNQVAVAPLPAFKKLWFRSQNFRRAISEAINRQDLCRVVFGGHARPGIGPVSPANQFWFNKSLQPHQFDPQSALRHLKQDGFRLEGATLRDREGYAVEFSLITNAGNKSRERMATMIQEDLSRIGIRLNIVTLDFPSLIERITRTFDYEACLLGLINDDLDPNAQMNVWLSSASNHQWNPQQKSPETPWEAEIDRLMRAQASSIDDRRRKADFDQVQKIVWEQVPFIYLVNKNALSAISPALKNCTPVALRPQTYWNAESISIAPGKGGGRR